MDNYCLPHYGCGGWRFESFRGHEWIAKRVSKKKLAFFLKLMKCFL